MKKYKYKLDILIKDNRTEGYWKDYYTTFVGFEGIAPYKNAYFYEEDLKAFREYKLIVEFFDYNQNCRLEKTFKNIEIFDSINEAEKNFPSGAETFLYLRREDYYYESLSTFGDYTVRARELMDKGKYLRAYSEGYFYDVLLTLQDLYEHKYK